MKIRNIIILLILLLVIGIVIYNHYENKEIITDIAIEDTKASVKEYYVYGTKLNIKGELLITDYQDVKLVIYGKQQQEIDVITDKNKDTLSFKVSEEINNGLYLDNLSRGNHYLFLKIISNDNEIKYYSMKNDTEYEDINYYTLSKYNNYIHINFNNKYNTLALDIEENKKSDIYDITIDAGHGGFDSGAVGHGYYEKDIALDVALEVWKNLKDKGLKVAITRSEDISLEEYNLENTIGRAVIPNYTNSKYLFSIHLNSHAQRSMHGLEILTPPNIDYTFAKTLAKNIVEGTGTNYSNNLGFKMYNGVYTRIIDQKEIDSRNENSDNPYNIKIGASYYYILREPGAYMTGAYVNGQDKKVGINPYYNANKGVECYTIELGYIINSQDVSNITNNKTKYASVISDTIYNELIK